MALATICPHCNTTFRVAPDQLKLHGGIVRCGACNEVFDGNNALIDLGAVASQQAGAPSGIRPESLHSAPAPEPEPEGEPASPKKGSDPVLRQQVDDAKKGSDPVLRQQVDEEMIALPVLDDAFEPADGTPEPEPEPFPEPSPARGGRADFQPPLLMRASASAKPAPAPSFVPKPPVDAARKSNPEPHAAAPLMAAPQPRPGQHEPEFVKISRRKEQTGRRRRGVLGAGAALLVLALAAQSVMTFRNVLAARHPQAKPLLALACAVIGCKIELPAQIDTLSVETGELQLLDANTFSFTTLLRNQANLVQAWPHLELALTDANDKPLVRRVFTPADYLPQGVAPATGIAPRSEQVVRFAFELNQVKASGYRIAIFYP